MEKRVSLRKLRLVSRELKDFCTRFLVKLKPQTEDTVTIFIVIIVASAVASVIVVFAFDFDFAFIFHFQFSVGMPKRGQQQQ